MKTLVRSVLALAAPLWLSGCDEGQETPVTQIFVLVDLSQTWDRPEQQERNDQVLKEVGHGISLAANDLEPPISVQYRVIGANSLERPPLCEAVYRPRLAPTRSDADYEVSSRSSLKNYLTETCPIKIEEQPAEPLTEIRTAIASVANQPAAGAARREILVISDFLEETQMPISLESDLKGFHATLVYRPVDQDLNNPTFLRFRLAAWKAELEAHGASVDVVPDTALRRQVVASYLMKKQTQS
jgi:hypothetical protein